MKRLLFSIIICILIPSICWSWDGGDPKNNIICIMSGNTIAASGTSTYIIDLNSPQLGYRPSGEFSLQFKGFTQAPGGGTTITATWQGCNALPTGVTQVGLLPRTQVPTSKMASTVIVTGMNIFSGNTEYAYGFFFIDTVRYVLVNVTSGSSNVGVTAYVKVD